MSETPTIQPMLPRTSRTGFILKCAVPYMRFCFYSAVAGYGYVSVDLWPLMSPLSIPHIIDK
jgi:hypothetical protein